MKIVDISAHQKGLKISNLKNAGGVIIRAAYGTNFDICGEDFIRQALACNMPYGLYMADYAANTKEAREEADFICDIADKFGVDFPIFFDTEGFSHKYLIQNIPGHSGHTKDFVRDITVAFCERVKERGYKTGFYFNKDYFRRFYGDDFVQVHPDYVKWLARPGVTNPDIDCDLWQYDCGNGAAFGYNANLDQNEVIDVSHFQKRNGISIAPPTTPVNSPLQYFKFPMKHLRVTQGEYDTYSHAGSMAMDFGGKDGGQDKLYCPCDMVVKRTRTGANGELYLESVDKVKFADGTEDYARMICLHDNAFNVRVGQVIKQDTYFYDEGGMGGGVPGKFANHVHIECGKGKWKSTTQRRNAQGSYVIENQAHLYNMFMLGEDVEIMVNPKTGKKQDGGYNWKRVPTGVATSPKVDMPAVTIPTVTLPSNPATFKQGDIVKIKSGAKYTTGTSVPLWVRNKQWYVKSASGNIAIINESVDGKNKINSPIDIKYLSLVSASTPTKPSGVNWSPAVGEIVMFNGGAHYVSSTSKIGTVKKAGKARVTALDKTGRAPHPIHLVRISGGTSNVYGWVDANTITQL